MRIQYCRNGNTGKAIRKTLSYLTKSYLNIINKPDEKEVSVWNQKFNEYIKSW